MTKLTINMQYRLLRNNKESGPYTKAQLEAMGLKPYDLLLIEGRGGAWQYASEIDDLKSIAPVVEEQPYDRFYKGKKEQPATVTNNRQTASFSNNSSATGTATLKPPKPRIRITGDKVVMIDNAALQQPQPINNIISSFPKEQPVATPKPVVKEEAPKAMQPVKLDWEEAYSEWKGEEKTTEEKHAPAAGQTMEEVRQRYEEAKLKKLDEKQHKTTGTARQNIMAAVAILVLAIGGYAGYKLNQNGGTARTTQAAPTVEKAEIVQDENNQPQSIPDDGATNTDNVNNPVAASPAPDNTTTSTNLQDAKSTLPADNDKTSKGAILPPVDNIKTDIQGDKKEIASPAKNTTPGTVTKPVQKTAQQQPTITNNKINTATNTTIAAVKDKKEHPAPTEVNKANTNLQVQQPVTEPPVVKKEAPAKKINDYIAVSKLGSSNAASVQNVLLSVKNKSDFPIDLAVIDIQYYAPNGRFQKGETMYVKNIDAGNNVNVRIPDSKTSGSIKYKVSLVSSEQKTLYLVGE